MQETSGISTPGWPVDLLRASRSAHVQPHDHARDPPVTEGSQPDCDFAVPSADRVNPRQKHLVNGHAIGIIRW